MDIRLILNKKTHCLLNNISRKENMRISLQNIKRYNVIKDYNKIGIS